MTVYFYLFLVFASFSAAGLAITICRLSGFRLPGWVGAFHGMAGLFAVGAFFIINLNFAHQVGAAVWWSLGAFAGGVIGGLIFFRVLFPKAAPLWAILGHASMAALGLYLLYVPAFVSP